LPILELKHPALYKWWQDHLEDAIPTPYTYQEVYEELLVYAKENEIDVRL